MYCPKCGCEYRPGYTICADCQVNLVDEEPPMLREKNKYAGFFIRTLAFMLDCLIIGIIDAAFSFELAFVFTFIISAHIFFSGGIFSCVFYIFYLIFFWLYFSISESSKYQATFGKRIVGITVSDCEGNRLSFKKASIRTFSKIFTTGLLSLIILADSKKQGIHDFIANTVVLNSGHKNRD